MGLSDAYVGGDESIISGYYCVKCDIYVASTLSPDLLPPKLLRDHYNCKSIWVTEGQRRIVWSDGNEVITFPSMRHLTEVAKMAVLTQLFRKVPQHEIEEAMEAIEQLRNRLREQRYEP